MITGVLAHYLTFGSLPELDDLGRPKSFYGDTIHDRCYRRPFYDQGKFAKTFDDEGARNGWCLFELGCKGPVTHNACATAKWNGGTSFPIESGHGCLGCSEPDFWDARQLLQGAVDAGRPAQDSSLPPRSWAPVPGWRSASPTGSRKAPPRRRTRPSRWPIWRNEHELTCNF